MYTIQWNGKSVSILDQRKLPLEEIYTEHFHYIDVADAIKNMEVRGAPAIGIASAMGITLAAIKLSGEEIVTFRTKMNEVLELFASTRPTAVNLFKSIERMRKIIESLEIPAAIAEALEKEAKAILEEDITANKAMGKNGSVFLEDGDVVMTHCNAGALATGGYGTALGVIRAAIEEGKKIQVIACETRPFLQGARLTAWELLQDNIPVTVITDSMAGHYMKSGLIKKVIVGADRIAANGDTANKIGTYSHSVLAKSHGIPFYVAAPLSTFDLNAQNAEAITIEERDVDEVAFAGITQVVPEGVRIFNPAFDVTPAINITAIITEKGIIERPDENKIKTKLNA